MSYRVLYSESFHEALEAQLDYSTAEGVPQTRC